MSSPLETAWATALEAQLGPSGPGADAGIMAAQLRRAISILQRPPLPDGSLFGMEPSSYHDRLMLHAPAGPA
jgi:hypothetical protein